jgi:predicted alpha/beta-hydrolase family hydrolase
MNSVEEISISSASPAVKGYLHKPLSASGDAMVLTHGAGGNAQSSLLATLAAGFASAGVAVLRYDLPFRQLRRFGPPRPGDAERDRHGLANAAAELRKLYQRRIFLGGQSYGGRQASMLCAEEHNVADALLLLSYPLHPPGRPDQLRTQHLPGLHIPVLFVQGTHDPFGSIEEIEAARKLIPRATRLLKVEGAGHDLGFKGKSNREDLPALVVSEFLEFTRG